MLSQSYIVYHVVTVVVDATVVVVVTVVVDATIVVVVTVVVVTDDSMTIDAVVDEFCIRLVTA